MKRTLLGLLCQTLLLAGLVAAPSPTPSPEPQPTTSPSQGPELMDIRRVDPRIVVELRYAGSRNIAGRPLYPPGLPALVRPAVAVKLRKAQDELALREYRLKIWDAWRPKAAHEELWRLFPNKDYVGNPNDGIGSLHTWGVAVDATMVDKHGREVTMPTDFDAFSPAAMLKYTGRDPIVEMHLHVLQRAMSHAGFWGMRTEWWHFISRGWTQYKSIDEVQLIAQQPAAGLPPKLNPGPQSGSSGGSR